MFGINGGEFLILLVIAVIVVGPERMPEYARQLRDWVRGLRAVVDRGREQLKEEVGDDVDWTTLDPRQYDPRRIVRDALTEPHPPSTTPHASGPGTAGAATAIAAAPALTPVAPGTTGDVQRAPFDTEAT